MLRNDTQSNVVAISEIDTVMNSTKPQGTLASVIFLFAATRYQGSHDRHQTKGPSRMDTNIILLNFFIQFVLKSY